MNVEEVISGVAKYTKSSKARLRAMAAAVARIDAERIDGDIVECGVWRAGNIILARMLSPQRICWLYDTFAGMANPSDCDVTRAGLRISVGKAAVSLDEVVANLSETGTLDLNWLRFILGPVESTLRNNTNLPSKIALLRLDTDWYKSTKIELEVLWPLLQRNGVLIIDDYGHWKGARKAVDDYFGDHGPEKIAIDYTAIMMVKP
jgi:O-methyltransferase